MYIECKNYLRNGCWIEFKKIKNSIHSTTNHWTGPGIIITVYNFIIIKGNNKDGHYIHTYTKLNSTEFF